jgi:CRP-like cAMP-binding protein
VLSDLAGRVSLRRLPAGKPIFRQGDRPTAFYIVRSGTVQIVEEDPETGKERVIRTLVRGDTFGELGLIDRAPRSATARPAEDAELFEIDQSTFDRLLAAMVHVPEFAPTLEQAAEIRALRPFATLGSEDIAMLQEHGSWEKVAPGDRIVVEGDEGDAFYVIGSGRWEVTRAGALIGELGPGDHFGEIALLSDVPRTATVVARTPARVYRLDREGFDAVLAAAFRQGRLAPASTVGRTSQH